MSRKRGGTDKITEKGVAQRRAASKLQRFRPPTPKGSEKETLLAAIGQMRSRFPYMAEFSRQVLENDLRDPKTKKPLMENVWNGKKLVSQRVQVPTELRVRVMESMFDRLGMPRQSEQSLVTDGKLLGPEIRITLGDFQRPGAEVGVREGDAQMTTPIPPVAENGSGNGVAH